MPACELVHIDIHKHTHPPSCQLFFDRLLFSNTFLTAGIYGGFCTSHVFISGVCKPAETQTRFWFCFCPAGLRTYCLSAPARNMHLKINLEVYVRLKDFWMQIYGLDLA